jgi:hypothetical protein
MDEQRSDARYSGLYYWYRNRGCVRRHGADHNVYIRFMQSYAGGNRECTAGCNNRHYERLRRQHQGIKRPLGRRHMEQQQYVDCYSRHIRYCFRRCCRSRYNKLFIALRLFPAGLVYCQCGTIGYFGNNACMRRANHHTIQWCRRRHMDEQQHWSCNDRIIFRHCRRHCRTTHRWLPSPPVE